MYWYYTDCIRRFHFHEVQNKKGGVSSKNGQPFGVLPMRISASPLLGASKKCKAYSQCCCCTSKESISKGLMMQALSHFCKQTLFENDPHSLRLTGRSCKNVFIFIPLFCHKIFKRLAFIFSRLSCACGAFILSGTVQFLSVVLFLWLRVTFQLCFVFQITVFFNVFIDLTTVLYWEQFCHEAFFA